MAALLLNFKQLLNRTMSWAWLQIWNFVSLLTFHDQKRYFHCYSTSFRNQFESMVFFEVAVFPPLRQSTHLQISSSPAHSVCCLAFQCCNPQFFANFESLWKWSWTASSQWRLQYSWKYGTQALTTSTTFGNPYVSVQSIHGRCNAYWRVMSTLASSPFWMVCRPGLTFGKNRYWSLLDWQALLWSWLSGRSRYHSLSETARLNSCSDLAVSTWPGWAFLWPL